MPLTATLSPRGEARAVPARIETVTHGRHPDPDPAQQDRQPGRGDALPFLSLGLFHHHPRVARLLLRDPRPRRPPDRGAADVLPRAGLSPSGRPHPRALRRRRHQRRRRVRLQPSLRRRPAARLRHGVRRAGLRRRQDRRLLRLDRAQGRRRRRGAGLDLGQRHRDVPRGPAAAADQDLGGGQAAARHRAHHPDQQPPARADARRHPRPDRGDADGRRARQGIVRALRRRRR